jgi:hypothetical protein
MVMDQTWVGDTTQSDSASCCMGQQWKDVSIPQTVVYISGVRPFTISTLLIEMEDNSCSMTNINLPVGSAEVIIAGKCKRNLLLVLYETSAYQQCCTESHWQHAGVPHCHPADTRTGVFDD